MQLDLGLIKDFYTRLEPLTKDEVWIILGAARKKYAKDNPDITTSHEVVTRQMVRYNDEHVFIQAIRKTAALLSVSTDKNTKKDFPPESHAIYIAINPRSTVLAKSLTDDKMNRYFYTLLQNSSEQGRIDAYKQIKRFNVHYYSALQKAASKKTWRIVDVDIKNPVIIAPLMNDLIDSIERENIKFITKTHGGYHIIYDRRANERLIGMNALWQIKTNYGLDKLEIEVFKDRLTPIWGTRQGGYLVRESAWGENKNK